MAYIHNWRKCSSLVSAQGKCHLESTQMDGCLDFSPQASWGVHRLQVKTLQYLGNCQVTLWKGSPIPRTLLYLAWLILVWSSWLTIPVFDYNQINIQRKCLPLFFPPWCPWTPKVSGRAVRNVYLKGGSSSSILSPLQITFDIMMIFCVSEYSTIFNALDWFSVPPHVILL